MNFILTKFIYPLEEKLEIADGYYFDNPRTSEEIKYVEKFIRKASPFPPNDRAVGEEGYITIDYLLSKLKEKYRNDPQVEKRINVCKYKNPYYKAASMWVILRLKGEDTIVRDYYAQARKIHCKIDALTLLSFEEYDRYDFSVLISGELSSLYEEEILEKTKNSIIESFVEVTNDKRKEKGKSRFYGFINYYRGISEINKKIQGNPNTELLEYVMESLQTLRKNFDLKMKFVSIVSIIELLLTHCPDNTRYNVEDSINRQFKNKVALICHLYDESSNFELITKECDHIYSLRSDVAHGNFNKFPKDLERYYAFCKENNYTTISEFDKIIALEVLIKRTMKYMVTIFNMYLNDYKLLEIVKNV